VWNFSNVYVCGAPTLIILYTFLQLNAYISNTNLITFSKFIFSLLLWNKTFKAPICYAATLLPIINQNYDPKYLNVKNICDKTTFYYIYWRVRPHDEFLGAITSQPEGLNLT